MTEEANRCNLCGKELKESDGENWADYEYKNELNAQCIYLCKECRTSLKTPPEIIQIRDIPFEQAKKEIAEYCANLKDKEIIYPSDIVNTLKLDLEQTIKAVDELIKEGKIEIAEEENGKENI